MKSLKEPSVDQQTKEMSSKPKAANNVRKLNPKNRKAKRALLDRAPKLVTLAKLKIA